MIYVEMLYKEVIVLKKKSIFLTGGFILIIAIGSPLVFANTNNIFYDFFKIKQEKVENVSEDDVVVEGEDFKISKKEYIDYKENLYLIHKMNGVAFDLSSEEIVKQMVENKALIQEAKKADVSVTDIEINEYAMQTKKAVEQSEISEIHEIHKALAKNLNVSLDDYFTHPDILKEYKNLLLVEKHIDILFEQEVLNDDFTVEDYTKKVMNNYKNSLIMNLSIID